jgi:hypothetical protein
MYNTTDSTVSSSFKTSSRWEGLAIANGFLYVVSGGKINKCTISPFQASSTFELPGYHIFGIAYDGTTFWVSASKLTNNYYYNWPEIIKISGVD